MRKYPNHDTAFLRMRKFSKPKSFSTQEKLGRLLQDIDFYRYFLIRRKTQTIVLLSVSNGVLDS
jgi:hypothetical protein